MRGAELSDDLVEKVISGDLDCEEGIAESHRIFDQFLTVERGYTFDALMAENVTLENARAQMVAWYDEQRRHSDTHTPR